jgi:organic radical activating enzyme
MYRVHSIFLTIQGEGINIGQRAVFVRFSGCNMWSGEEKDRSRDALRSTAPCAMICDTVFKGHDPNKRGGRYDVNGLVEAIIETNAASLSPTRFAGFRGHGRSLCVLTGGEPGLQVDGDLVSSLRAAGFFVAIETNGSVQLPGNIDHVVLSPKLSPDRIIRQHYDELKVLYPIYDPKLYETIAPFRERWVQPVDPPNDGMADPPHYWAYVDEARKFVLNNPGWRLSIQAHKVWGVE